MAVICLILGMGMPTTASYIVVSTLMAPVVVELGAQSGLVVPLVAVHMFVFYFGLMADVTPPVGLASFAAAAISRADFYPTGITAFWYSIRTGILPFMFIFNTELLLIGIHSFAHLRADRRHRDHRDAGVRRGDAGLVHHAQPLVRVGPAAARDLHLAAAGLLARSTHYAHTNSSPPQRLIELATRGAARCAACACASKARPSKARTLKKTVLLPLGGTARACSASPRPA